MVHPFHSTLAQQISMPCFSWTCQWFFCFQKYEYHCFPADMFKDQKRLKWTQGFLPHLKIRNWSCQDTSLIPRWIVFYCFFLTIKKQFQPSTGCHEFVFALAKSYPPFLQSKGGKLQNILPQLGMLERKCLKQGYSKRFFSMTQRSMYWASVVLTSEF